MTKEEFIKSYCDASRIEVEHRTPDGYTVAGCTPVIACPCHCGEEDCEGWQMASQTVIDSWLGMGRDIRVPSQN